MIRYVRVLGGTLVACLTLLTACSADLRSMRPYIESTTVHSRPVTEPVRAITSFRDGIVCMDELLRDNHVPTTLITSKIIPDVSGKAPVATKDMIITALSEMSRTSNAFRVVDFEIDPLRQDTVQTLTSLMLPSGQLSIPKPQIYISGAISYVDQNTLLHNSGFGASGKNWEIGYSNDMITTVVGLELHIGDFNSRTLFPGIDSANELVAGNRGIGLDLGARIKKAGVQFTMGDTVSQGVGPAVRTLVDLGLIELVGKWARVPYWQCLALDQAHPEFQRQLHEWYEDMDPVSRTRLFQMGLRTLGYYDGDVDGKPSRVLKSAIARFQTDTEATVSGNLNFETYERLVGKYVETDTNNGFRRIGWGGERAAGPADGSTNFAPTASRKVDVKISLSRPEHRFQVGESLLLNVSTDRTAYLYCFYRDAKGVTAQIYPSAFQPSEPVQAKRSVLIPDFTNPNIFSIDMTQAGKEAALCIASMNDLGEPLEKLGIKPLEPITQAKDLADLDAKVRAQDTSPVNGKADAEWEVTE